MSFRSVLVCYTAGFTTIITTLRRITFGKENYFLRTGFLQTKTMCLATADNRNSSTGEENHHCKKYRYYCITEPFHTFSASKNKHKKSREEKNNSFYQSSIKLIYGRTEGKSNNDDSFEPPNTISANSIISISKSHGFVTPS